MTAPSTPQLTVELVAWDDARAVELRDRMEDEMSAVYAGRSAHSTLEQRAAVDRDLWVDPASVLATVLLLDASGTPVAHAAMKDHDGDWELKRVIVLAGRRGSGIGTRLMAEVEAAALAGGARRIILQTGDRQPDAVRLYERCGYRAIPVYEPYASSMPFSLCFEKRLAG